MMYVIATTIQSRSISTILTIRKLMIDGLDLPVNSNLSQSTSSAEQRTSRRNPGSVQNAMKLNL